MNSKFVFTGTLRPAESCANLYRSWMHSDDPEIWLYIQKAGIAITFEGEWKEFKKDVYGRVTFAVNDLLSAQAFCSNQPLEAVITHWVEYEREAGNHLEIGFPGQVAQTIETEAVRPVPRLLRKMENHPALRWALADYDKALSGKSEPREVIMYANRAIESVRNWFTDDGKGDWEKRAWEKMRAALGFDKDWLTYVTDLSKTARHGFREKAPELGDEQAREAFKRCKEVLSKFIDYLQQTPERWKVS